ncbi:MAG: hypothetical protein ABI743_00985 [bacterium]
MKALLLTATATLLLALTTLAPAQAAQTDYLLLIDGITGDLEQSLEALDTVSGQPPDPIDALRKGNRRMINADAKLKPIFARGAASGETDMDLAAETLAGEILEAPPGQNKEGVLLLLFMKGSGLDASLSRKYIRKSGDAQAADLRFECLITGILNGLLIDSETLRLPESVTDPLHDALAAADEFSPLLVSYDLKAGKK